MEGVESAHRNVQRWKLKMIIKSLEAARGKGTSLISLIIPPKDQISRVTKMLADESGTAFNIKDPVNRRLVQSGFTLVQRKLKSYYNEVPSNGLVIYCGTTVTDDGKERKVIIDFQPFTPINTFVYRCDNKFHTEALSNLLTDETFAFIVMDGNGALFGTICGNTRDVLHKFTVNLPKKHGRGGQSALCSDRLRMAEKHKYIRKMAETAAQLYITNGKANVTGLIIACSADFKTELSQSDLFDQRLQTRILKLVDVSYGGENGFNQAINLASEVLEKVKLIQENKLIVRYFDEISQDTGKFCFGVPNTLKALEMGAVDILIVVETLEIQRLVLKNHALDVIVRYLTPHQERDQTNFVDPHTGVELNLIEKISLLEWLANNYNGFGASLEIITDRSQKGAQFCKGFGGIGGILRYRIDF